MPSPSWPHYREARPRDGCGERRRHDGRDAPEAENILIVDDNKANLQVLSDMLKE